MTSAWLTLTLCATIVGMAIIGDHFPSANFVFASNIVCSTLPRCDGTEGDDVIRASINGNDISGNGGDDIIYGERGNDIIRGGAGDDTIWGWEGNDNLNGDSGNDKIDGHYGNDYINGGDDNDNIAGGSGDDDMGGMGGADRLYGGTGNDIVVANDFVSQRDFVADYVDCGLGNDSYDIRSSDKDYKLPNCEFGTDLDS